MLSRERVRFWYPLRAVTLQRHGDPAPGPEAVAAREQAAYQKGHADASAAMNQQILEQRRELAQLCETLFRSLEEGVSGAVAEVRSALPELTMQALRRVLSKISISREMVISVVEELLAEIGPDVGPIELRMHPEDLDLMREVEPQLSRNHPGLQFVADETLRRGDCEAATRFGKVDGRLENKLAKLEASLGSG